jgi:peptidoglycan L-alanyl-D-glutamate endopeptidase CwlK
VKKLQGSVGLGGANFRKDVMAIQNLLAENGYAPGAADGRLRMETISAIQKFQRTAMKMNSPDGLIEPGGITWQELIGSRNTTPGLLRSAGLNPDSSKWTMGQKLQSLHPELRPRVDAVLRAMRKRGFEPTIHHAWRSVAEQAKINAAGNSGVPFSFHNAKNPDGTLSALAADIVDATLGWKASTEFWNAVEEEAKKRGLYWGGDWTNPWDPAHVQLLPKSELTRIRRKNGY